MNEKCKNCGADWGLHRFDTGQCPVGGCEAPIWKKQEWAQTTYVADTSEDMDEIRETIKKLAKRIEELEEKVENLQSESGLEESVRIWGTGE